METPLKLMPDNSCREYGEYMIEKNPYCILNIEERKKFVKVLLDNVLEWALMENDARWEQGIERRSIDAAHVKVLLDALEEDNTMYDERFIQNWIDLSSVNRFYEERRNWAWWYMTWLVINS